MTQELQHESFDSEGHYIPRAGIINPKSFDISTKTTKVYRKLQTGDNRSAIVSIPISWTKLWKDSKLCGYVRMTLDPESGIILLEGV